MAVKKPVRALVTGGAGFIGSHLCEELLRRGFQVTAVDNFSTSSKKNIEHLLKKEKKFTFFKSSILDERLMERLIAKTDIVYHLAAAVGVKYIITHPVESIITNIDGTENVLKWASRYRKKVLIASSSEVYGHMPKRPVKENDRRVLGATFVTRWNYAATKSVDEFLAHAYVKENHLKMIIVRLFNTIGPRQNHQYGMVFPRFIRHALKGKPMTVYGKGRQIRTFTYVRDTVNALIQLTVTPRAYGQIFNVSSGARPVSIKNLALLVKRRLNSKSKIVHRPYYLYYGKQFEDVSCRIPNISKLKKTIRFRPEYPTLERMIDETALHIKGEMKRRL